MSSIYEKLLAVAPQQEYSTEARNVLKDKYIRINNGTIYVAEQKMNEAALIFSFANSAEETLELFRRLKDMETKLTVRRLRIYYMPRIIKESLPGRMINVNLNSSYANVKRLKTQYKVPVMTNQPSVVKSDSAVIDMSWVTSTIRSKTVDNKVRITRVMRTAILALYKKYITQTFSNTYKNKILYFRSPISLPAIRTVILDAMMMKELSPAMLFMEWFQNDPIAFKLWLKEFNITILFESHDGRTMVLSGRDNFTKLTTFKSKYVLRNIKLLDATKEEAETISNELDKELIASGDIPISDIAVKDDKGVIDDELKEDEKAPAIDESEFKEEETITVTEEEIDEVTGEIVTVTKEIPKVNEKVEEEFDSNLDEEFENNPDMSNADVLDKIIDENLEGAITDDEEDIDEDILEAVDEIETSEVLMQKRPAQKDYFKILADNNIKAEDKAVAILEEHNYTKLKAAVDTKEVQDMKRKMLKSYGRPVGEVVKKIQKHNIKDNSLDIDVNTNTAYNKSSVYKYDQKYKEVLADDDLENILTSPANLTYPVILQKYEKKDVSDREFKGYRLNMEYETHNGDKLNFEFDIPETVNSSGELFMGSTPKKLMLQNAPKPVIKQDENVVITTAYNKCIMHLSGKYISIKDKLIIQSIYKFSQTHPTILKVKTTPELGDFIYKNEIGYHLIHLNRHFVGLISESFDVDFRGKGKEGNLTYLGEYMSDKVLHNPELDKIYIGKKEFDSLEGIVYMLQTYDAETWKKSLLSSTTSSGCLTPIATIMGKKIPVVLVILIAMPLKELLEKLKKENNLEFKVVKNDDLPKNYSSNENYGVIRMSDYSIILRYNNPTNELLLSYLTEIDLSEYETFDITQVMKEETGNWNTALYIENFIDLFIDPTTKRVCELYGIPDDFVGIFIYAVSLFTSHITMYKSDIRNYRLISQTEIINRCIYDVVSKELSMNAARVKRGSRPRVEAKRNDVILRLQSLNTLSEANPISGFRELMEQTQVSFKGHNGINEERAYSANVRMFNQNNYGAETCATPYGANAGITKYLPFDPAIANLSGEYEHHDSSKDLDAAAITAFSDAYTPYTRYNHCVRRLMQSGQFSHILPADQSDAMLVGCHADEAAIKMTPKHSYIAKSKGVIKEINDNFIIIEYDDKTTDAISLINVERNPDKGYYIKNDFTYDPKTIKVGKKINPGDVVAYSKDSYRKKGNGKLGLAAGVLTWVLVSDGQAQWEDSALPFQSLSDKLATKVVKRIARTIDLNTEVRDWNVNIGSQVKPTDVLLKYKLLTEDAAINDLLINAEELSLKEMEAKYRGKLVDVRVYYRLGRDTVISQSIKKFMKNVDDIQRAQGNMASLDVIKDPFTKAKLDKRPQQLTRDAFSKINGDNIENGQMLVEFYIEILDKLGAADKIVLDNALKGEPTTVLDDELRPVGAITNRKCNLAYSTYSIVKRMTPGMLLHGKLLSIILHASSVARQILNRPAEPGTLYDYYSSKAVKDGKYKKVPDEYYK